MLWIIPCLRQLNTFSVFGLTAKTGTGKSIFILAKLPVLPKTPHQIAPSSGACYSTAPGVPSHPPEKPRWLPVATQSTSWQFLSSQWCCSLLHVSSLTPSSYPKTKGRQLTSGEMKCTTRTKNWLQVIQMLTFESKNLAPTARFARLQDLRHLRVKFFHLFEVSVIEWSHSGRVSLRRKRGQTRFGVCCSSAKLTRLLTSSFQELLVASSLQCRCFDT